MGNASQVFKDLATTHPDLASQWHPTKNGNLTPKDVSFGSVFKIWWLCEHGHSWIASVNHRSSGTGCAVCRGLQVEVGFNDLGTLRPDIAAEWHPTKNGELTAKQVTVNSNKKVWWLCEQGHSWALAPNTRHAGNGCATCAGQKVEVGFNDLGTLRPDIAAEWHPTKNGELTAKQVTVGSGKMVWWICDEGHEWTARPATRLRGSGCAACATTGFDPAKPALLYLLRNPDYQARKVGITNEGTTRIAEFVRTGWSVVNLMEHDDGQLVATVEKAIFRWLRHELAMPIFLGREEMWRTRGWTETFSLEGPSDAEVIARIEAEFARLRKD